MHDIIKINLVHFQTLQHQITERKRKVVDWFKWASEVSKCTQVWTLGSPTRRTHVVHVELRISIEREVREVKRVRDEGRYSEWEGCTGIGVGVSLFSFSVRTFPLLSFLST